MPSEIIQVSDIGKNALALPSWRRQRFIALFAVALAPLLAYLGRIYEMIMMFLGAVALLGLVMFMLSVACGILNWIFARKWPRDCTQAALVGGVMFFFVLLTTIFSSIFSHMDDVAVLAYPEKAVPVLEEYKQTHGKYPDTLAEVSQLPPLPRGLTYYGRDKDFVFFRHDGGFFRCENNTGRYPKWKWTDD